MKVGFYSSRIEGMTTGPGVYRENLARELLNRQDDDLDMTLVHHQESDHPIYEQSQELLLPQDSPVRTVLNYFSNTDFSGPGPTYNVFSDFIATRQDDFDLVHMQGVPYDRLFWLREAKPKLVTTIHGPHWLVSDWSERESPIRRWLYERAVERFDAIFTVSEFMKRFLVDRFGIPQDTIYVTPNAPPVDFEPRRDIDLSERFGLDEDYILHSSNASPRKNPEGLIRGYEQAVTQYDLEYNLVVTGDGWKNKDIARFLSDTSLRDRISILGYVSRKELQALYTSAELFFLPSFTESCSFAQLEAAACHTPVLTTDADGMPEASGDAAVYINDPTNYGEIARRLIETIDRQDELIENISKIREDRSWEKTALRTAEAYRTIAHP